MNDLYSRAFRLVHDIECSRCGKVPQPEELYLNPSEKQDLVFEANHKCECGVEYSIEVQENEESLKATIERIDTGGVRTTTTGNSRLRRESHPAREQLHALYNLQDALDMLRVNWARVEYIAENRPDYSDDIPLYNDRRFYAQVFAEVHNYLASAYTFQETFNTAIQKLPSGRLVDSKFQQFKEETRVVIGLRTYVQHEQMFGMTISLDVDSEEYRTDLRVKLEKVWTMESQVTEDNPHGYDTSPEEIYGDVAGEYIDLLSQFESHFNASKELVGLVSEFAHEEMGDELDDVMRLFGSALDEYD